MVRCPSDSLRGCAIGSVDDAASSETYKPGTLHDLNMYTGQVYMGKICPGKQTIGIMWAQPDILVWNIAHVIR